MKLRPIISGWMLIALPSFGQPFKLAGIEYAYYPKTAVKDSKTGQELAFREFGAFVTIPIVAEKPKVVFLNGLRYGQLSAISYNSPIYSQPEVRQTFHTVVYSLNIIKQLSPKWLVTVGVLPTIASDFTKKLSGDDFLVQAVGLARYRVREGFDIGGGLAYNTRFGRQLLLPVVQLSYQQRAFRLNAVLPANLIAYFQTRNERLRAGLRIRTAGSFININDQYMATNNIGTIDKLSYTRINVGPLVEWKLIGPLVLELSGGITARRRFDFVDADKNIEGSDAQSSPFLNIGLLFVPARKGTLGDGIE